MTPNNFIDPETALTLLETTDQLGYARSMFETVREPLLLLDGKGEVHMANAAFFRTFGLTSADTVGRQLTSVSNGQWALPGLMNRLERLQRTAQPFEDFEVTQRFDAVGERLLLLTGRLLDAPHNGDRMTLLAITDETDRRGVERTLSWHAAELERSNRDLEGFALVASHDLQEPLRKIRAYGDLLLTECAPQMDEVARDYATRIVNASARMQTLVADVLRLAVVSTGSQTFAREPLADVLKDVLLNMDLAIRDANATIEVSDLPTIECDRAQIRQLFQNLLSNALKFRRDVPLVIRVTTSTAETPTFKGASDGNPWMSIHFIDNGIGFEQRHSDIIFAPFQRLHGRGKYDGTGIGLPLCRRICERHFGSIATRSEPNVGSEFKITLPTRQPLKR